MSHSELIVRTTNYVSPPQQLPRAFWFNTLDEALTSPEQSSANPSPTVSYSDAPRKLPVARTLYSSLFSSLPGANDISGEATMPQVREDLTDDTPSRQAVVTSAPRKRVRSRKAPQQANDSPQENGAQSDRRRAYDRKRWRAKYAKLNKDPNAKERFLARRRKRDREQKRRKYAAMSVEERRARKAKAKKSQKERSAGVTRFLEGDNGAETCDLDAATIANLMSWEPPVEPDATA